MSCNKGDKCFEIVKQACDPGCEHITDTDCVFHNLDGNQLSKLPNIGIVAGTTLKRILKAIDEKFALTNIADFSNFNMHGLDVGTEIKTLKQFVEASTKNLQDLQIQINDWEQQLESLETDVTELGELFDTLNKINVSNSTLNINSTDELRTVINKILSYVEDLPTDLDTPEFSSSSTISFSNSNNEYTAESVLNPDPANIIKKTDQGLYATNQAPSSILNTIQTNNTLKEQFNSIITLPCFSFDLMASNNSPVSYVNCNGDTVNITVNANILKRLSDVRYISTPPSDILKITFKGIEQ